MPGIDSLVTQFDSFEINSMISKLFEGIDKYLDMLGTERGNDGERKILYFETPKNFKCRKIKEAHEILSKASAKDRKEKIKRILNLVKIKELKQDYLVSHTNENIMYLLKNDSNLIPGKVYCVNVLSEVLDVILKKYVKLENKKKPDLSPKPDISSMEATSDKDYILKIGDEKWYRFNERGKFGDLKVHLDDIRSVILVNSSNRDKGIHNVEIFRKWNSGYNITYFGKHLDSLSQD